MDLQKKKIGKDAKFVGAHHRFCFGGGEREKKKSLEFGVSIMGGSANSQKFGKDAKGMNLYVRFWGAINL